MQYPTVLRVDARKVKGYVILITHFYEPFQNRCLTKICLI